MKELRKNLEHEFQTELRSLILAVFGFSGFQFNEKRSF